MTARSASVSRKTNETAIEVSVAIDGTGRHDILVTREPQRARASDDHNE